MKNSRFTDSQIIAILKQAEAGSHVAELCREHGISTATFYSVNQGRFIGVSSHDHHARIARFQTVSFQGQTTARQ